LTINNRSTSPAISSMTTRYAAPQSQREPEEKRKSDDRARETQPPLVVRRKTWIDTVGNRRDVPRLPAASFGDSRLPDISFCPPHTSVLGWAAFIVLAVAYCCSVHRFVPQQPM